jgi:amino-acid N-acetyltransferase
VSSNPRAAGKLREAVNTSSISAGPRLRAALALLAAASLPTEDLTESHCEHFFYCGPREAPEGLVGLELFGDVALLRSLVVSAARRGSGAGSQLLAHAEQHARALGVKRLYLLTTSAESFFANRGYMRAPRAAAPDAIRTTREFSGLCPASSAFMSKQL